MHDKPKTALVTGGASGLGREIARRLLADGAIVVITDFQLELGRAVAIECGFTFIAQDVRDEERWVEVVQEIEAEFGTLDILVNNAGILGTAHAATPESTSLRAWKNIFSVNVEGVFLGCRAAIPAMKRAGGGSIVNMSSVAGLSATPHATAYGASKAAVRHLTRSVAQHCAQERLRIRCNSVHPGDVLTPLWEAHTSELARLRGVSPDAIVREAIASTPLGELVQSADVAAAVSFLVSDEARHITGSQLIVDGGVFDCDTYSPQPVQQDQ